MKRSTLIFSFLLIPVDMAMIILAFILSYKFRLYFEIVPALYIEPFKEYIKFVFLTLPGWLIVFALSGLYSISERTRPLQQFGKIFVASTAAIAIVMAWIFLSRTFFFSRLIIAFSWILSIITVAAGRYLMRNIEIFCYRFGIGIHRVIVLSGGGSAKLIVAEIRRNQKLGYRLVKIINAEAIDKLTQILKRNPADEMIIANATLGEKQIFKVLEFCRHNHLGFKMTPNAFLLQSSHVDIQQLAGMPILEFKRTPLDGWGKIIKRLVDLLGSLILLIIFSPVIVIVAILVKLTSRGPIFFCQERVGLEKNFIFYKFRTMREDAWKEHSKLMKKHGLMFKLKKDPRLSPVGGFLRRTSLDELPQFWNVLRGNMSLIGPRPPMPEEVAHYNNFQKKRLGVKPGITGLWQVSGRSDLSFDEWVRLDAYYIENWSLWLDFQIILKTAWVVIKGRGAY
ncbi:MAG: sugar transferase [Patescibacteria group bacterium]